MKRIEEAGRILTNKWFQTSDSEWDFDFGFVYLLHYHETKKKKKTEAMIIIMPSPPVRSILNMEQLKIGIKFYIVFILVTILS